MVKHEREGPTLLYPEDIFAVVLRSAADCHGFVVGCRRGVDHGDDGDGEVDPQHVGERHPQGTHEHKDVPGAKALCKVLSKLADGRDALPKPHFLFNGMDSLS